jgi:hypothetical protein
MLEEELEALESRMEYLRRELDAAQPGEGEKA